MAILVGVNGACGRMGQRVIHCVVSDGEAQVAAAIESPNNSQTGKDIGEICGLGHLGTAVSNQLPAKLDVVIDFSLPEASIEILNRCIERKIPLVIATTGHTPEQLALIEKASSQIPILKAANLSLVVNLLFKLAREAGKALKGKDFDVEIIEHHHRFKADSPSGTALRFAEIIEKEMNLTKRQFGREGILGERPRNELGLHAIRGGDNVGEHTIIFSAIGETLELVHRSSSRDSYAKGAVAAAKFLVGKAPGQYAMADVLGL